MNKTAYTTFLHSLHKRFKFVNLHLLFPYSSRELDASDMVLSDVDFIHLPPNTWTTKPVITSNAPISCLKEKDSPNNMAALLIPIIGTSRAKGETVAAGYADNSLPHKP